MASFDPRRTFNRLAGRAMNLPLGIAEQHLPLPIADRLGRLTGGSSLERSVAGKTILITGASSGIGEAAAMRIGAAGGKVLLVARSEEKLGDIAARIAEHGGVAHSHPADLYNTDDIARLADEVITEHGGVDILVNNAGKSIRRSLKYSLDREHDFERTLELNYLAPVRLVLAFLPGMRERGFGHVVNVSSAAVQIRTPRFAAYTASKAALDAFSDCAAAELSHDGIRFTTISMPLVRTPMIAPTAMYQRFPSLSPEQAANRVCTAIVHRPRKIGVGYGALSETIGAIDPVAMETIRNRAYKRFPESGSRSGDEPDPRPSGDQGAGATDPGEPAS
ncbi:MAG TPA: SDR family NAD(P)-dependent oxidoreductase [Solirubrobacterales bacterium]|nr:SDR family NAD(P)-dependent oxidoreductase [Solirubrobacterales bacterium]